MIKDIQLELAIERAKNLLQQRKEIQSLPPEKGLDKILSFPQATPLIHSFPEEDLYFLINDIGHEDSLPVLSLASNKQWQFIIDSEAYEKDRIDFRSVTHWLNMLIKADPDRFIKWFLNDQLEFVELYMFKNLEVKAREHDQDPSDLGDDFDTFDDVFYFKFKDDVFDLDTSNVLKEERDEFLSVFLRNLSDYDHVAFQNVLLESTSIIPAETEEEVYRLRNVRLAEKGFLPFEEAIGIYQPLKPDDLPKAGEKVLPKTYKEPFLPVPQYFVNLLDKKNNLFIRVLKRISSSEEILQYLQIEFAGLSNQIISADRAKVRSKEELKLFVSKASDYISIAMESLIKTFAGSDEEEERYLASLIEKYPLYNFFRVGFGFVLELKWKAQKWKQTSWFLKNNLTLSFWDEEWLGVLGGILIKKPLYFDNYKSGVLYREFSSLEEIRGTEKILNCIIAIDDMLKKISVKPKPVSNGFITYKNFLLTLFIRNIHALSFEFEPVPLDLFKVFFDKLFAEGNKTGELRKIKNRMKEDFLQFLSNRSGDPVYDISKNLGQTFENLFLEIENEYGGIKKENLDPRFIKLIVLSS